MTRRAPFRKGTRTRSAVPPALLLALAAALAAAPALADGTGALDGRACGGDAFTYAEVTEQRPAPPRGTPLVSIPDTLCADLAGERRPALRDIQVVIDPRSPGERPPPRR